jgi:hypothetical protein
MSEMAKKAREAMKAKAKSLSTADPSKKVDSSTWTPPEPLNTEAKTGLRPISRRAFKKGGKVMGEKSKCDMGRKPRQSGGSAKAYAIAKINRNVKEANEERPGIKHVGGMKKGGRAHKAEGGGFDLQSLAGLRPLSETKFLPKQIADNMKKGGRAKKAEGGDAIGEFLKNNPAQNPAPQKPPASTAPSKPAPAQKPPSEDITDPKNWPSHINSPRRKHGGKAHTDEKMDIALIKKMVKPGARKARVDGGETNNFSVPLPNPDTGYEVVNREGVQFGPYKTLKSASRVADKKDLAYGAVAHRVRKIGARKNGGKAHSDEKMDKALIKKMVKPEARKGKNIGGMLGGLIPMAIGAMDKKDEKKSGGRAARKEGGGVFSGPGYPGKIPGVVPGGREARAMGGKTKRGKGKTNINIVIAAGKPADGADMMGAAGPMGGPTRPPGGMPVPVPPPQGVPPMPPAAMPMPMPMPQAPAGGPPMPRKSGGRLTAKASSYKDMTAGAGSGEGRLQKTDIAKLHKDAPAFKRGGKTYRSYKDMDAGAGSGVGRLEKTEIQAHKR